MLEVIRDAAPVVRPPPPRRRAGARRRSSAPRDGGALTPEELTALFSDTRPEVVEDMRQAADALRAELAGDLVTFVVNRNINVSNVCIVGCSFCGFGVSKRSPDAYEHDREEFVRRIHEAVDYGATEICMQSGIHPDWGLEDYLGWLRLAKETAPQHAHARLQPDGDRAHVRHLAACRRPRCSRACATPGWTPRRAPPPRCSHDGVRERISPNKLPVARWVEIIEASHRSRPALDGDRDVRPHRAARGARRAHARRARAAGAHRRLHRVRAAVVHPVPHAARAARTACSEISREDNLRHTAAFRLALGRTIRNAAGELGEDGRSTPPPRRCAGASTTSAAR